MEQSDERRKEHVEEFSTQFLAITDISSLQDAVVGAAYSIVKAEESMIFLLNEGSGEFYLVAEKSLQDRKFPNVRVKVAGSAIAPVVEQGHSIRLSGMQLSRVMGDMVKALMGAPLTARGRTFGVLCVVNKDDGGSFSKNDEEMLDLLANRAAGPLNYAITLAETKRRAETVSSLTMVSQSLLNVRDLQELLAFIAKEAHHVLDADVVVLFEYVKEKDDVIIPPIVFGEVSSPHVLRERGTTLPHRDSVFFKVLRNPEPFYAPVAQDDWVDAGLITRDWGTNPKGFIQREAIVSSAGIPLVSEDEPVGLLFINYRTFRPFTPEQRERAEAFANLAALAIQNARGFAQRERYVNELSVISDFSRVIGSAATVEVDQILKLVYQQTKRLMDVTNFCIALYDEPTDTVSFRFVIEGGADLTLGEGDWLPRKAGNGLIEYVIRQAEPLLIADNLGAWLKANQVDSIGPLACSWLGVPMIAKQRVLGVIALQDFEWKSAYGIRDRDILTTVAAQAAMAIKQANDIASLEAAAASTKTPGFTRSIIFDPEQKDAGIAILSYFGTIVRQKYPEDPVSVSIKQEGDIVRLIVESADGDVLEQIEETLYDYGLVVVGRMAPEDLLADPFQVAQLKHKLEMTSLALEHARDLIRLAERYGREKDKKIENLEVQVQQLHQLIGDSLRYGSERDIQLIGRLDALIGQYHGVVQRLLQLIRDKVEEPLSPEDEREVEEALEGIGREEPALLRRLKDHVFGALSSATGSRLYAIIMRIIEGLPQ